jgi:hypothetical protein
MTSDDRSSEDVEATAAEVRQDPKKLQAMMAENFIEFESSGRAWTRNSIIELLSRETAFFPPAVEDFHCDFLSDDVALVTYRTVRTDPNSGEVLASLRSSIWTNESGSWRMRFHQGTRTSA